MRNSPAAKGTGLKRLDETVLRKGDIVLVTARAPTSAAIRFVTRSDVSHAMVCVEDRSVIDATDEGVHARNTQRLFFDEACPVYVLRLKGGITSAQLDDVTQFLRQAVGTRYSVPEAMLAPASGFGFPPSGRQFCSRLVAQAFASASIELVAEANFCSPADIKASALLESVPNPTVPVDEPEVAFWKSRDDVPQLMVDATNAVLSGARAVAPWIESFGDIADFLLARPEHDAALSGCLTRSGYLTVWQTERSKNPWQYELALMEQAPSEEIRQYCDAVLANEGDGPNRYVLNRAVYASLAASSGLRYFVLMRDLYGTLAELHRQRVDTAKAWLPARGAAVDGLAEPLEPHSDAWFEALEEWDPPKAAFTRFVVQREGRLDVCCVCGDDPAHDYRLPEGDRPPAGVDTLRLCDDCWQIRWEKGERLVPIS